MISGQAFYSYLNTSLFYIYLFYAKLHLGVLLTRVQNNYLYPSPSFQFRNV
ncbi:MAG: hypothetical protein CH6_3525 [Candidatus Kapaibacterium sp.]|nr:MAG: hypothetical protein CH6_3525 [Candidatus Kapabacteria bacterium]